MRYASAEAFRRALETRLLALSRETSRSLVRLRKEVAFDRLLARRLAAAPGRWVLKGGLALDYRFGDRARTTRDIDLAMAGGEDAATTALIDAQAADLDDFFVFAVERTARLDQLQEAAAVRYHVRAQLSGRVFEEFALDVAFDLPPDVQLETVRSPDLLAFAGIPPVEAPALPLDVHVAEKVHAYTRAYGQPGATNTRVKDLVDLALIAALAPLDAERLRVAINGTFARRDRHAAPAALPPPPPDWQVPYRAMAREVGIPPDLAAGLDTASALLNPILDGSVLTGTWHPIEQRWLVEKDGFLMIPSIGKPITVEMVRKLIDEDRHRR